MTRDSMIEDRDWIRIAEHLEGRDSSTDQAAFERWMSVSPERQRLVDALQKVWGRAADIQEPFEIDARAAWLEVQARLARSENSKRRIAPRGALETHGVRANRWMAVAAAAAILVLGIGVVFASRGARHSAQNGKQELAVREVVTAQGQRAEMRLADGSRVVLGVESRLRWPMNFGSGAREVSLEGEALFVVTHDSRPFVVRSGNAVIDDLGTEFGVRAYPGDRTVRVVVRNGLVAIAPLPDTLTHRALLHAGDGGDLAADGAVRIEHGVDVERELAFAEGRLELNDAPMVAVARELERWYGVTLVVDDTALVRATVNASFGAHEELGAVLRTLARTLGARVERRGRVVRLIAIQEDARSR